MTTERFDWCRDCGDLAPGAVVRWCRAHGVTFEQFATDYAGRWPFDTPPPADLVAGMVRDLDRAALALDLAACCAA